MALQASGETSSTLSKAAAAIAQNLAFSGRRPGDPSSRHLRSALPRGFHVVPVETAPPLTQFAGCQGPETLWVEFWRTPGGDSVLMSRC